MSRPDTWRSRVPSATISRSVSPWSARTAENAASRKRIRARGSSRTSRLVTRCGHRRQEPLLALDPAEVGPRVEAARPDVGQPRLAVDVGRALRQPQAGLAVAQPRRRADVDAADGVDEPDEAEEVDLEVVVDADPGAALDRGHGQRRAAEGVGGVELVAPLRDVGAVLGLVRRDGDVGVAREADHPHRAVLRRDVHQQHGVRAPAGGGGQRADVQPPHLPAGHALAGVGADEEERRRAARVRARAGRRARRRRRPARSTRSTRTAARGPTPRWPARAPRPPPPRPGRRVAAPARPAGRARGGGG